MGLNQSEDRFNGVITSLAIKAPCKTVSDAGNILLEGEQTLTTIAVVAGDRVLVIAQTDPVENGIYNVRTSAWERAADFDGNRDVAKGTVINVNRPTNNITAYVQINLGVAKDEPTIGTDPLAFNIFFSQNNSIDDLSDVDTTGCTDNDLMHFVAGVLVCTLGQLTYDGVDLLLQDGSVVVGGFNNKGPQMRGVESNNTTPTLNPKANEPFTGWGGNNVGELAAVLDNSGSGIRAMLLDRPAVGHTTRRWNRETITASTTQTQGNGQLSSSVVVVSVVANDNDTVTLIDPLSALDHIVINAGANTLQIFPKSGHDLGQGTNNPMSVAAGGTAIFFGINSTTFHLVQVSTGSGGIGSLGALRGAKAYRTSAFRVIENPEPDIGRITNGPGDGSGGGNANAEQIIAWNAAVYDTDNIHDPSTNNTRFTVPAGITAVEMMIGMKFDDETSTPQTGGLHVRLRKNGVVNGAVDSIFVVTHNNGDPGWIPWNTDGLGMATQDTGGPNVGGSGQVATQQWYSGTIFVDPADYLEVALLSQAGLRDIPLNGIWAEMRLLQ